MPPGSRRQGRQRARVAWRSRIASLAARRPTLGLTQQRPTIRAVEVDLEQLVARAQRLVTLREQLPALLVEEDAPAHAGACTGGFRLEGAGGDLAQQIAGAGLAGLAER